MTAPFDRSVPASSWGPMVAPPCDTGASHTSSQFTPSNMAIYVIGMLLLWLKWIGWSRRRQLRFSVSSGDVRPLSSRRPLKLDNPAKLCWFHAVAQYASAATVELRPDVEFSSIQATLGKSWQLLRTLVALPACAEAACDRFTGRRR